MPAQPSTLNSQLLLQNLETLADTPEAVAKLRRLILQIAVEGRLLPADKKPESAKVLVKRLEKARLRAVGEGLAPKHVTSPVADTEKFFRHAPEHWT